VINQSYIIPSAYYNPYQNKKVLHSKGNHQENKKAMHGMGEDIYKWHI